MNEHEEIFMSFESNGEKYLNELDLDIPIRIRNILKNEYFCSKSNFYRRLEYIINEYTSYYLFPNNYVAFYPSIRPLHSKKIISCNVSGSKINIGELYFCYRPLIENLSTNDVYTIKETIKVADGYQNLLPQTLSQFEEWYQKNNCYQFFDNNIIDFYNLNSVGNNCLQPYQLKKAKK